MESIETYKDIYAHLEKIVASKDAKVQKQNEQQMGTWFLNYMRTGQTVMLQELQNMSSHATHMDLDQLNRIFYHCCVKEVVARLLPSDESRDLPLATSQARAIKLIALGYLRLRDVFNQDALYGVYTGTNIMKGENFERLKEKLSRIHSKYHAVIQKNAANPNQIMFFQHDKLHQDLIEFYGGTTKNNENEEDYDSDGEGYDSETANKLYSGVFSFSQSSV